MAHAQKPDFVLSAKRTSPFIFFYTHGSVHRESNLIIVKQDVTYSVYYIYRRVHLFFFYTWVRASWIEFNNCPTRCDLFSLLHFCRQLYMFRVSTPIIRSSYNCNYSFWYWLDGSITIRSRCWVGTVRTQQREWMLVDQVNQRQKL